MIQIVGQGLEHIVHGNVWAAGERFATFVKAGLGMITLELPQIDENFNFVPLNEERFLREFIPAYLREFHASDEQVNNTLSCVFGLVHAAQETILNPAVYSGDFITAVTAMIEGAIKVVDALEKCQHQAYLPTLPQVVSLFVRYPFQVYLQMTINNVLEMPKQMATSLNMDIHARTGQYAVAGKEAAEYTKTMLKNILHF